MSKKEIRQKQEVRRATKALRHAVKRKASEYRVSRIQGHINAVKSGKAPMPIPQRAENRLEDKTRKQDKAAKVAKKADPPAWVTLVYVNPETRAAAHGNPHVRVILPAQ